MNHLLRLYFISHVALEGNTLQSEFEKTIFNRTVSYFVVGPALKEARAGKFVGTSCYERQIKGLAVEANVGLTHEAVDNKQDPIRMEDAFHWLQQKGIPHKLVVRVGLDT